MIEAINSSALTKLLAILFIFFSLIAALVVIVVYLIVFKTDPPRYVEGIVYLGLAASINTLGVHIGAVTMGNGASQAAAAMPSLPPITRVSGHAEAN
jgi:O-antigen/teichoic acid export membrane protein